MNTTISHNCALLAAEISITLVEKIPLNYLTGIYEITSIRIRPTFMFSGL